MSRSWHDYIRDIREEIIFIKELFPALTYNSFIVDNTLKRAIIRSLEIIGEAVKIIPEEIKSKYPVIDWKDYAGLRDKLIHHYFGIDYEIVWDALITDIPILAEAIETIIIEEKIP
jgi:uncharacterized protein with HEPN domain